MLSEIEIGDLWGQRGQKARPEIRMKKQDAKKTLVSSVEAAGY